jgi:hypothetical protein
MTKKPPAEPTIARIAVGFSGESTHPPCAYSAVGVANMAAQTRTNKKIFVMNILRETFSLPLGWNSFHSKILAVVALACAQPTRPSRIADTDDCMNAASVHRKIINYAQRGAMSA